MKIATFTAPGNQTPLVGAVSGETVTTIDGVANTIELLVGGAVPAAEGVAYPLSEVKLLAPVLRPSMVYGIGLNYSDHAKEVGAQEPPAPVVFPKVPGSITAPSGPVRVPSVIGKPDYEGELAVIINGDGGVAGYCIADDVTGRDLQGREPQWVRGKGADTFCPLGPWLTTADEIADPHDLEIKTWVNGDLRQDSSTSEMIYKVPELIEFIAQTCTLNAGDVVLTGTPAGVGMARDPREFLASGDTVRIEIEGLGAIEHQIES